MANKKNATKHIPTQSQRRQENKDFTAFKVVLFYCLLIIFFPILTFFLTKVLIFDGYLKLETIQSNIYSAISAIIALHIALGVYISKAYFMPDEIESIKQD